MSYSMDHGLTLWMKENNSDRFEPNGQYFAEDINKLIFMDGTFLLK